MIAGVPVRIRLQTMLPAIALAGMLAVANPSPAKAEIDYPYCMKVYVRGGPYTDCSYSTLAQCQASASGRSALCYLDPFYEGKPGSPYVVKRPRYPYSPFGNIDPSYDPYRVEQPPVSTPRRHHRHRKQTHH
jgi:hypothetical protein